MSFALLARDPDLSRLLDDGYEVVVQAGHLIVRHIPYVTQGREIRYGFLAYPVSISGDRIISGTDHRIWFGGAIPCSEEGLPLQMANAEVRAISSELAADYMLSSKPLPNGYPDEYTKVVAYSRMIAHPAQALDPSVTATPGAAYQEVEDDQPFHYRDTASSRAGLAVINQQYRAQRVSIVGLGGTGSYILDQVAKTPVADILLVDGDVFENHNAFRAPGAPTLQQLRDRPTKAEYFQAIYSRMHKAIRVEPTYLDDENLEVLTGTTFAFLASDDPLSKPPIITWLEGHGVPFIDVGMGIEEIDGRLTGLLRVTTSLADWRDHAHANGRLPAADLHEDDYGRNIQTADLNALNAQLAIVRWKRHLGCYADLTREGFSTYSLATNEIANEDQKP